MNRLLFVMYTVFMIACIALFGNIFLSSPAVAHEELIIVGGGMAGCMEAYYAYRDAQKDKRPLHITIYEQNKGVGDTTVSHLVPSLTPDEIISVVPCGKDLVTSLNVLFSEPGGMRVDDVQGIQSASAQQFQQEAQQCSLDHVAHAQRTDCLLELGKMSMDLWQDLYTSADAELREILETSFFNPCQELKSDDARSLNKGYRIDLIYNIPNAHEKALRMKRDYEKLGYKQCALLTPAEVIALDPFLADFCNNHSVRTAGGVREWQCDTVALWRPGGCLDTPTFLPRLYAYLEKHMGASCFKIQYDSKVTGIQFGHTLTGKTIIKGLRFENREINKSGTYVFCPGESVGTLKKLGLKEPACAGFAGAVLALTIAIPEHLMHQYQSFNQYMEVHHSDVILAWQARCRGATISIGCGGTKAFYGDQRPDIDHAFTKNRNILQLNIINDVLPEFVSWALKRDTKGAVLTARDLQVLESQGIASRWVGLRSVAYDGFPSVGFVYHGKNKVVNARCTNHLGSGGVSFAPAAVTISRSATKPDSELSDFEKQVLRYGKSGRSAFPIRGS